jgi:hypothetical protein
MSQRVKDYFNFIRYIKKLDKEELKENLYIIEDKISILELDKLVLLETNKDDFELKYINKELKKLKIKEKMIERNLLTERTTTNKDSKQEAKQEAKKALTPEPTVRVSAELIM